MQFYSTNNHSLRVDLKQAVLQGLASDNGLYMPEQIPELSESFFKTLPGKSFLEIASEVASHLLGNELPPSELRRIVEHTIQFDAPLVALEDHVYALELFHGPTLAFKDFGARFLAGLLGYYASQQSREITILVATSGDTGSAVANGFLNVPGTRVIVLYPSGKVSEVQEKQFTTLGGNITALEVAGTFDDCQRLVKSAFLDTDLRAKHFLTSANSISIARLVPQSFYYFHAFAQLKDRTRPVVVSVPSGNYGNLTAGILAKRMGLPIKQFVAATNLNDIIPAYLKTREFLPRPSTQTISNAMDVGNPSNFARLMDLFDHQFEKIAAEVQGFSFSDKETEDSMLEVYRRINYTLDPHGAVGYLGLKKYLRQHSDWQGIFLETAHPGKFQDVVERALGRKLELPEILSAFLKKEKKSQPIGKEFATFKEFLLSR